MNDNVVPFSGAPRGGRDGVSDAVAGALRSPRRSKPLGDGETPCDPLDLAWHDRSDLGNAHRLRDRFGQLLLHVDGAGWHVWDKARWQRESGEALARLHCYAVAERIRDEVEALAEWAVAEDAAEGVKPKDSIRLKFVKAHNGWAVQSGNAARTDAMLKQAVPFMLRQARDMDARPYLFNTVGGTLDLDGEDLGDPDVAEGADYAIVERGFDPADLLTRQAPTLYDPKAECPRFLTFLAEIQPDAAVRRFLQAWFGYCLTGKMDEQALLICHGIGANGKSTLLEVLHAVLGDYAATVDIATFLANDKRRGGDATPDLARLPGVRLAIASEPAAGDRLNETVIKTITGGEKILARHLFRDLIEFDPTFKIVLSCNQKPSIRGQDKGIWRRIRMLHFPVSFDRDRIDRGLKDKLLAEASGILNWMLDGYRIYREEGVRVPDAVRDETDQYRTESDPIGEFVRLWTFRDKGQWVQATELYKAYQSWCRINAHDPGSQTMFGRRMADRGYRKIVSGTTRYEDIALTSEALNALEEERSRHGKGGGAPEGSDGSAKPNPPPDDG